MTDISDDTKKTVVRDLTEAYGLAESSLESEWNKWSNLPETNLASGASVAGVKKWFVDHLKSVGLVSSRDTPPASSQPTMNGKKKPQPTTASAFPIIDEEEYDDDEDLPVDERIYTDLEADHEIAKSAAAIPQEVFEKAEARVMETLMKQALDLHATETKFEPAGASEGHRVGSGRGHERVKRYALASAITAWAGRHTERSLQAMKDSGSQLGNALALLILELDGRKTRGKAGEHLQSIIHPIVSRLHIANITSKGIEARHRALIHILIEGIVAAGRTSVSTEESAAEAMKELHGTFHRYKMALTEKLETSQGDLPSGLKAWDRLKGLGRGARKKVRAMLNERDLRTMLVALVSMANMAVPMPGEDVIPGFGKDADMSRQIRTFGRHLEEHLKVRSGSEKARRTEVQSLVTIWFLAGALESFVTHGQLRPFAPQLVYDADDQLDAMNPSGYGDQPGAGYGEATEAKEEGETPPPLPPRTTSLAKLLVEKTQSYFKTNPSILDRASRRRSVLMVPGDPDCLTKVEGQVRNPEDSRGASRYIEHALLLSHPNPTHDKQGVLVAISGDVFRLSSDSVLQQMRRAAPVESQDHHQTWENETNDLGGPLVPHPNRLPMRCAVGKTISVNVSKSLSNKDTNEKTLLIRPLYYWPTFDIDSQDD